MPPQDEPMTKGTILHSLALSVREIWGDAGLRIVKERLDPETRAATTDAELLPIKWYPTRYLLAWNAAVLDGPAKGDADAFRRCVARSIDLGFGRVRRAFLGFATPKLVGKRASELWRYDHTHGTLVIESDDLPDGRARAALTDYPFVTTPTARMAIAEVIRHVLSLSRARNVKETHALQDRALVIQLRWDA